MNRWLAALPLAAWAGYVAVLAVQGRLALYLHPVFRPWTVGMAVVLALMAAGLLASRRLPPSGHGPDTRLGWMLRATALLVPIAATVLLQPQGFSLQVVLNRSVAKDPAFLFSSRSGPLAEDLPLPGQSAPPDESETPPDNAALPEFFQYIDRSDSGAWQLEVLDLIFATQTPALRQALARERVELVGQVVRGLPGAEGQQFSLVRLLMMCCAADARPVGIWVDPPAGGPWEDMEWVRVTGRPEFPLLHGRRLPLLRAESISPCPPPKEWFLFQ